MKRLYIADYISKRTGEQHAAGSMEYITENINPKRTQKIIEGVYNPSRLENLILHPIPTLMSFDLNQDPKKRHREEERLVDDLVEDGLENNVYQDIATTSSIVIPSQKVYQPLFQHKFVDLDSESVTLSSVVEQISEEHPDTLCSILVAACRAPSRERKSKETIRGLPLWRYNTKINEDRTVVMKGGIPLNKLTYAQFDSMVFFKASKSQSDLPPPKKRRRKK